MAGFPIGAGDLLAGSWSSILTQWSADQYLLDARPAAGASTTGSAQSVVRKQLRDVLVLYYTFPVIP